MNETLDKKIKAVYQECKLLATKHEPAVLLDNHNHTKQEIWDEYCRQINYTNVFLSKKRDLEYLKTLLSEASLGIQSSTPSGAKVKAVIDGYKFMIDDLLRVYSTINVMQKWILEYYQTGGGLVSDLD